MNYAAALLEIQYATIVITIHAIILTTVLGL